MNYAHMTSCLDVLNISLPDIFYIFISYGDVREAQKFSKILTAVRFLAFEMTYELYTYDFLFGNNK